jgi:hypothetical protein
MGRWSWPVTDNLPLKPARRRFQMKTTVLFSLTLAFTATLTACEPDSNVVMPDSPTRTGMGSTTSTGPANATAQLTKQLDIVAIPSAIKLQSVEFIVSFKNCADRTALINARATTATLAETPSGTDTWSPNVGQAPTSCVEYGGDKTLDYFWSSDAKPPYGQMPAVAIAAGETVSLVFELPLVAGISAEDLTVNGSYSWTDLNGATQRKLF